MNSIDLKIKKMFEHDVEKAFSLLYEYYFNELSVKGISIIGDYATVEDIIQNLFLKIYKEKKYKDIKDFENYLKFSVRNECINHLKKIKMELVDEMGSFVSVEYEDQRLEDIKEKVNLLPVKCREIFEQVVYEEYTYESVARKKNISLNTVKSQMKIAYKTLRNKINSILF